MINVSAVFHDRMIPYDYLYKDGVDISGMASFHRNVSYGNVITLSLRITYNNTEDVTGRYYYRAYLNFYYLDVCFIYCNIFHTSVFPVFSLHWNIRSYIDLISHNYSF